MGASSARPARLRHFHTTADGIAEGIERRVGAVASERSAYVSGNEYMYQVDVGPILDAVEALADTLRSFGEWVGGVGYAFAAVDDGDLDDVHSVSDDWRSPDCSTSSSGGREAKRRRARCLP